MEISGALYFGATRAIANNGSSPRLPGSSGWQHVLDALLEHPFVKIY